MACRRQSGAGMFLLCLGLLAFAPPLSRGKSLTRLKALDEAKEKSTQLQSRTHGKHPRHGRLLIGHKTQDNEEFSESNSTDTSLEDDADYQADMGWWQMSQQEEVQPETQAIERLLKMEPKVECTEESMKLLVQGAPSTPASLLFVDRGGHLSPLSLSRLPSSCGYTVRSSQRDLILVVPYTGCFISIEEDSYVLPLRWCGLQVRMSCPLMQPLSLNPPMVTCHSEGMVVTAQGINSASKIKVNVAGDWEPLLQVTKRCLFSIVEHPEGVVISVRYAPCIPMKDGLYRFDLATDEESKISCPSLFIDEHKLIKGPHTRPVPQNPSPPQVPPKVPGLPQNPKNPKNPSQKPKDPRYPKFPYHYYYPGFSYPHPPGQETPPTAKPQSPTPAPLPPSDQATKKPPSHNSIYVQQGSIVDPSNPQPPPASQGKIPQTHFPLPPGYPQNPAKPPLNPHKVQQQRHFPPLFYQQPMFYYSHLHSAQPGKHVKKPGSSLSQVVVKTQDRELHPFYHYPQPKLDVNPDSTPSQPQEPLLYSYYFYNQSKPGMTLEQMYYPYYFYNFYHQQNQAMTQPGSPQTSKPSANPGGQTYQTFYMANQTKPGGAQEQMYPPYFAYYFYNQQNPSSRPSDTSKPQNPHGQMYHPFPYNPQKQSSNPPSSKPQTPQGQMYQFYPYHYYNSPKPPTKPSGASQTQTPQGQTYRPFYHYMFGQEKQNPLPTPQPNPPHPPQPSNPDLRPGSQPSTNPKVPGNPPPGYPVSPDSQQWCVFPQMIDTLQQLNAQTGFAGSSHAGLMRRPCLPMKMPIPGPSGGPSQGKPTEDAQAQILMPPQGQMYNPFYWFLQPQFQYMTLPFTYSFQQGAAQVKDQKVSVSSGQQTTTELTNVHLPMPPYCSQGCQSMLSGCCPQIAFHQHLHISPASFNSDAGWLYPGLPLMSLAFSEFNKGVEGSISPEVQATVMQTVGLSPLEQTPSQSPPTKGGKQSPLQPADGSTALKPGSGPSKPKSEEQYNPSLAEQIYSYWPYLPQNMGQLNIQQSSSTGHNNDPVERWSPDRPIIKYEPSYSEFSNQQYTAGQSSGSDTSNPNYLSYIHPYFLDATKQPTRSAAKDLQSLNKRTTEYKRYLHDSQREIERFFSPHYMPQDAPLPSQNGSKGLNFSQTKGFSKNGTKVEHPVNTQTEAQDFVLLQHGPPGRKPGGYAKLIATGDQSPTDSAEKAFNARYRDNLPRPESLRGNAPDYEGAPKPVLGSVNYMPRLDEPGFPPPSAATDEPFHAHSSQEESLNTPDLWKPFTPSSSGQKFPTRVPSEVFQQWGTVDSPKSGSNLHLQPEHQIKN